MPSEESLDHVDEATRKGRQAAANMLFVEVLFWSNRNKAEAIHQDLAYDATNCPVPKP